jgi:hypothetical protein
MEQTHQVETNNKYHLCMCEHAFSCNIHWCVHRKVHQCGYHKRECLGMFKNPECIVCNCIDIDKYPWLNKSVDEKHICNKVHECAYYTCAHRVPHNVDMTCNIHHNGFINCTSSVCIPITCMPPRPVEIKKEDLCPICEISSRKFMKDGLFYPEGIFINDIGMCQRCAEVLNPLVKAERAEIDERIKQNKIKRMQRLMRGKR